MARTAVRARAFREYYLSYSVGCRNLECVTLNFAISTVLVDLQDSFLIKNRRHLAAYACSICVRNVSLIRKLSFRNRLKKMIF